MNATRPLRMLPATLRLLLDNVSLGYACLDARGRAISWSHAAVRLAVQATGSGRGALQRLAACVDEAGGQRVEIETRDGSVHVVVIAGGDAGLPSRVSRVLLMQHVQEPRRRFSRDARRLLSRLPPRRRAVAEQLIYTGGSQKEIASVIDMPCTTLRTHVALVYRDFSVGTRAELQALFVR